MAKQALQHSLQDQTHPDLAPSEASSNTSQDHDYLTSLPSELLVKIPYDKSPPASG